jgi:hypothetical protein
MHMLPLLRMRALHGESQANFKFGNFDLIIGFSTFRPITIGKSVPAARGRRPIHIAVPQTTGCMGWEGRVTRETGKYIHWYL